jgi:hypothetical protein
MYMMSKDNEVIMRINLTEEAHTELTILAMRKKIRVHEFIKEILEKYADKRKETSLSAS